MKNQLTKYIIFVLLCCGSYTMNGQVSYGIDLQEDQKTYIVSLKSDVTLSSPFNTTSTAQITIKFPTSDSVKMENLTSLISAVAWNKTVCIRQPLEAVGYDYITFGLGSLGTTGISYTKDSTVSLFSFQNTGEKCAGLVEIINNQNDVFLYPNSEKLSIKNQMSVLGIGINAHVGLYKSSADCETQTVVNTEIIDIVIDKISLFPNPASNWLNVMYDIPVTGTGYIIIYDALGRTVKTERLQTLQGQQTVILNIEELANSAYFFQIKVDNYYSRAISFIKSN
jgi:hypothetical protein